MILTNYGPKVESAKPQTFEQKADNLKRLIELEAATPTDVRGETTKVIDNVIGAWMKSSDPVSMRLAKIYTDLRTELGANAPKGDVEFLEEFDKYIQAMDIPELEKQRIHAELELRRQVSLEEIGKGKSQDKYSKRILPATYILALQDGIAKGDYKFYIPDYWEEEAKGFERPETDLWQTGVPRTGFYVPNPKEEEKKEYTSSPFDVDIKKQNNERRFPKKSPFDFRN